MSGTKKLVLALTLVVLMICGISAGWSMANSAPTYDGTRVDLVELYENPSSYDNFNVDGAAAIMVNENLEKTAADNVVFSVVFNFRGYDTMGESFILIAAIAGSLVILRKTTHSGKKEEEHHEENV